MPKTKKVINFLLSFITSLLLAIVVLLLIIKWTVYNANFLKNTLDKNNYYELLMEDIDEEIMDYNTSSGIPNDVLKGLYTIDDIKSDVNNFIDNYYLGKSVTINNESIMQKLKENIDNYLLEHDVSITSDDNIDSYISEIGKIYTKKIGLYSLLNKYASTFKTFGSSINIMIVITFIGLIINTLILRKIKTTYGASIIIASGLILLFIRFIIFSEIEVTSLVIISQYFSKVIIEIYKSICNLTVISGALLIILGLIMQVIENILRIKRIRRRKRSVIYGRI